MACSSCAEKARARAVAAKKDDEAVAAPYATEPILKKTKAVVVEASDTDEKVLLRYYGGGNGKKVTRGCRTCGGGGTRYSTITSEHITFASEDAPNGLFDLVVSIGHDYYVTKTQAEYMLTLTYQNAAGRTIHKFKEV